MNRSTVQRLLEINRRFYQDFAVQFSETRQRIQPGVQSILERLDPGADVLDLGCGNGELAQSMARRGFHGSYTGIDISQGLLDIAREKDFGSLETRFLQADLAERGWDEPLEDTTFDVVLAFAVLHHLPGAEGRRRLAGTVRERLRPGGRFIHSVWQFQNSPRLMERVQPWETVGIDEEELEPGDTLLDWRSGGRGVRYVHLFREEELRRLAEGTGFQVEESFYSDGEGGRLGLYSIWSPRQADDRGEGR